MSILLETLNHQSNEQQKTSTDLPNVHSSHYDDEMLGDERLFRQLKLWRLTCFILLITLIVSWSFFWITSTGSVIDNQRQDNFTKQLNGKELTGHSESKNESIQSIAKVETAPVISTEIPDKTKEITQKPTYVPQKRVVDNTPERSKIIKPTTNTQKAEKPKPVNRKNQNFELAIYKEELPSELLELFPLIVINSYVISDDAEKSFVIMDGAFYKINQVIAPDLTLRQITAEQIVVEFYDQLVKIKLK